MSRPEQTSIRTFAVLPAAGASRRMRAAKLLLPWNDSTVIEAVLASLATGGVERTVMPVCAGDAVLAAVCRKARADVVLLPERPSDMTASLQRGMTYLQRTHAPQTSDAVIICPADVPWIRAETVGALIASYVDADRSGRHAAAIVPTHGGRRGHPLLLDFASANSIASLAKGESLRTLVERIAAAGELLELAAGPHIHGDLDTPEDYRAALARFSEENQIRDTP